MGPGFCHLLDSANPISSARRRKQRRAEPELYPFFFFFFWTDPIWTNPILTYPNWTYQTLKHFLIEAEQPFKTLPVLIHRSDCICFSWRTPVKELNRVHAAANQPDQPASACRSADQRTETDSYHSQTKPSDLSTIMECNSY